MRIGIIGKIASGKSTCAEMFVKNVPNTKVTSFAKKVKELACTMFGMNPLKKNRPLLVNIGEKMREIDDQVWINVVLKEVNNSYCVNWVVDDVRHKNEYDALKRNGFRFIRLQVNEHVRQLRLLDLYKNDAHVHADFNKHVTETELNNVECDATFIIDLFDKNQQQKQLEMQVLDYIQKTSNEKTFMKLPIP